jgi:RyR domain
VNKRERLARAIHDAYVRQKIRSGAPYEETGTWDELPESRRESSLKHADDIEPKLGRIGMRLTPAPADGAIDALDPHDVEMLARHEHKRWCAERRAAGWKLGEAVDAKRRTTPWLIDWEDLPEDQREMDRALVRAIPAAAAGAGLAVVRDA